MTRTKPSSIFCTGLALPYRHVAEKLQTSKFRPTEKFENLLHLQFIFWKPITWIFLSLHFAGYFVTRAARMNCPEDFKPESCAYDRQVFPFVSIQHLVFWSYMLSAVGLLDTGCYSRIFLFLWRWHPSSSSRTIICIHLTSPFWKFHLFFVFYPIFAPKNPSCTCRTVTPGSQQVSPHLRATVFYVRENCWTNHISCDAPTHHPARPRWTVESSTLHPRRSGIGPPTWLNSHRNTLAPTRLQHTGTNSMPMQSTYHCKSKALTVPVHLLLEPQADLGRDAWPRAQWRRAPRHMGRRMQPVRFFAP